MKNSQQSKQTCVITYNNKKKFAKTEIIITGRPPCIIKGIKKLTPCMQRDDRSKEEEVHTIAFTSVKR
jgi:hypothetical protein